MYKCIYIVYIYVYIKFIYICMYSKAPYFLLLFIKYSYTTRNWEEGNGKSFLAL